MSGNTEGKVAEEQQPIEVAESPAKADNPDIVAIQTTTSTGDEQTFSRKPNMKLVREMSNAIAIGQDAHAYLAQSNSNASPVSASETMCRKALMSIANGL